MGTVEITRQDRIDEFVVRDAMSLAIDSLANSCGDLVASAVGIVEGSELTIPQHRATDTMGMSADLSSSASGELWIEEGETDGSEAVIAQARAFALASAMLVRLTTSDAQDAMRSEAARLAALAAREAQRVTVGDYA